MPNSIEQDVDLQALNTLAVPARAAHYAKLTDGQALPAILAEAAAAGWPVRVLGAGSNVVLANTHAGLTLHQCCQGIEQTGDSGDSVHLRVAAGENWHELVTWTIAHDVYGLENLALIPGTVGAAPVQNIGAYGVELAPFVAAVHCIDLASGESHILSPEQCQFGYRDSLFKHSAGAQLFIEAVEFRLSREARAVTHYPSLTRYLAQQDIVAPSPADIFDAVIAIRQARLPDPASIPNAGSFFKNPSLGEAELQTFLTQHAEVPHFPDGQGGYRLAAAWLIEQCGFKQRDAAVRVHPEHALVIINPQRQAASSIQALAAEIVAAVQARFGLVLEQEPRCV